MTRPKTDSVRVNIYLPRRLLLATKKIAGMKGITYSELMRNAVTSYLKAEVKK